MQSRQAWMGIASLGLASAACNENPDGDDGSGFELKSAAFSDDFSTLILTFSSEVGSLEGVQPTDFRISMARAVRYDYGGDSVEIDAYYFEPNYYGEDYNYYDTPEPVGMLALVKGPMPNQLSITLDPRFEPVNCTTLEHFVAQAEQDFDTNGHFFPHYAPGGVPLKGANGVALEPIGADWVLTSALYMEGAGFDFPMINPKVPIPCP